ncbi:flagellar export pore protein [Thiomonas sp. X19]|uniref:flagellar biosynthetic protein FliR n=1 Tax=Thiomonas sp. X19 TaxID=1050370 RepID=UPI000B69F06E|nr:flagellar biosynthetic protein FliR [Thiomonas sp. X19]SCC91132.1 flagellar export pore protein [Thiomonas sp. X19]
MIDFTSIQIETWIGAFFWPFLRVLAMLSVAPVFGATQIPIQVRVGLAVLIAVALAPALPAMPPVQLGSGLAWMLVVQQLLVGAVIGLAMTLILSAVQLAGSIIGLQMGLGFSTLFDPVQGVQVTTLASFLNLLAMLLFVSLNGHLLLLAVLARSFVLIPVGPALGLGAATWHALALEGSALFSLGLALAAPVLGVLIIANLGLATLSKLAPQLNLFAIGFPLFFALGFLALYLLMPVMQTVVRHLVEVGLDLSTRLLLQAAAHPV